MQCLYIFIAFSEPPFEKKRMDFYNIPCLRGTWQLSSGLWKKCLHCISKILDTYINKTQTFAILSAPCNQTCQSWSWQHFCSPSKKQWGPKAFRKQQEEALLKMQAPFPCTLGTAASKGSLLSFLLPERSWHFFQEMKEQKRSEKRQKKLLEKGNLERLVTRSEEPTIDLFFFSWGEKKPKKEKKKKKGMGLHYLCCCGIPLEDCACAFRFM